MKAIDKINIPRSLWYENKEGDELLYDPRTGSPNDGWYAQHSKEVIVKHNIHFGGGRYPELWPVRLMRWLIEKMPDKWKRAGSYGSASTFNSSYKIIKYLVDQRGFRFSDACIVGAELCSRCFEICENEINGLPGLPSPRKIPNILCKYCEIIDPVYVDQRRVWCCYRTINLKGSIAKAYKDNSPDSGKDYWNNKI